MEGSFIERKMTDEKIRGTKILPSLRVFCGTFALFAAFPHAVETWDAEYAEIPQRMQRNYSPMLLF